MPTFNGSFKIYLEKKSIIYLKPQIYFFSESVLIWNQIININRYNTVT